MHLKIKPVSGVSDHDIVFVQASTHVPRAKPPQRKIQLWKHMPTLLLPEQLLTNFATSFSTDITWIQTSTLFGKNLSSSVSTP
ncbi:hypothetical protein DPMN_193889 [Dreissena polymorpha]|uniref:Uncharacterized protein n=1 Tax=Dreissena polymorpha TaxID=45954 RepID=A0A9D3Y3W7_DREPO|nr:hypothetical protein DPMN_193889 [Dreissena polymorpha]